MPLSQSQPPLPSFVELMESLGLATDSKLPQQPPECDEEMRSYSPSRTPSSSPPPLNTIDHTINPHSNREGSPTIIVSQYDNGRETANETNGFKRRASVGNIKAARFAPYLSASRRGSTSSTSSSLSDAQRESKTTPSSRRSSMESTNADTSPPIPPLPVRRAHGASPERLRVTAVAYTPISSFARRRSPQASPTSPEFAQPRARSTSNELPSPVMLPTLPPLLAESFAAYSFPSASNESRSSRMIRSNHHLQHRRGKSSNSSSGRSSRNSERRSQSRSPVPSPMELDTENSGLFVKHHQAGLRISSFHRQVAPIA